MKVKIILFLLISVLLIGIVFSAGETTTSTISGTSGTIETTGILKQIGEWIGKGLNILADGVGFKKEGEDSVFTFNEGGKMNINGDLFENIKEDSSIKLSSSGDIKFADLTASDDTSFNFKGFGDEIKLSKGNRLVYENNEINIFKNGGKETISLRQNVFDDNGNNIGKFMDIKMIGDTFNIKKSGEGNIFNGNFEFGDNKISGLAENGIGRVIVSKKEGRITEILGGTDATMNGVDHKVSSSNGLKIFYEGDFNPLEHAGENYFNYAGRDKVYAGGSGFTTDLTQSTNIFGDMKTAKVVNGIGTKTRDLSITMNGGDLEISKYKTGDSDLGFNINGKGDYVINNGREIIESRDVTKIVNGKLVPTGESLLYVRANDPDGSLFSYDMKFNDGNYILEDDIFKHKNGAVIFNGKTFSENIVYNRQNFPLTTEEITEIEKQTGDDTFLDYTYNLKDELLDKKILESAAKVNISGEALFSTLAGEGWFYRADKDSLSVWDKYKDNPNQEFYPGEVSLTRIQGFFDELKNRGLISPDSSIMVNSVGTKRIRGEDIFDFTAATVKYCELLVKDDIGEKEYNAMTDNEKFFWVTYYYNSIGSGSDKSKSALGTNALTKKREETYASVNAKDYIANYENTGEYADPKMNAKIREAILLGAKKFFQIIFR